MTIIVVAALVVVGGVVLAFVLLSSSQATVPDLVGIDVEEARSLLEDSGLVADIEEVSYEGFEDGEVVSQVPAAGQKVEEGTVIAVEVNAWLEADGEEKDLSSSATITTSSVGVSRDASISYNPYNLIDNDYNTCWAEGNPGYGINDWVKFSFPEEKTITRINFVPGYIWRVFI